MKALIATACLLAVFGSAVPAQAQIVQIGNLEISEDVFEGISLTLKSPVDRARSGAGSARELDGQKLEVVRPGHRGRRRLLAPAMED